MSLKLPAVPWWPHGPWLGTPAAGPTIKTTATLVDTTCLVATEKDKTKGDEQNVSVGFP